MFICVNKTDALAWMWKTKLNKCKKLNDIRLYKSAKWNKDNTLMCFADNFFYADNIANSEWFPLKCVAVQYLCRLKLNNN